MRIIGRALVNRLYGENKGLLYKIMDTKEFAKWNGQHFEIVKAPGLYHLVRSKLKSLSKEAQGSQFVQTKSGDILTIDDIKKFQKNSIKPSLFANVIKILTIFDDMRIPATEFDKKSEEVVVANGILNLKTGQLREHNPDCMSTRMIQVNYMKDSECPVFRKFIKEISDDEEEFEKYLQVVLGYFLTSDIRQQKFFISFGLGANGKSVLFKTILKLFAGYGAYTHPSTILKKSNSQTTSDLPRLKKARLVVAAETNLDSKIDESTIKAITGGEQIVARELFKNFQTYDPQYKVVLCTNNFPEMGMPMKNPRVLAGEKVTDCGR